MSSALSAYTAFEGRSQAVAANKPVTQDEHVHPGAKEAVECFDRTADHWLVLIERGVEYHGHARNAMENIYQLPIARICLAVHRVKTTRSVYMDHGRD